MVPAVSSLAHQHFLAERRRRPEADVMREMRAGFLGDRLRYLMTGGAPTAPEVQAFLAECFAVPVMRGYAATETGMLTFNDEVAGNVLAFRLADAPELGYRTDDRPHPRGELLVKCKAAVSGYLDDEAATAALFDPDGYIRTGDVVEQRGPDLLVWIDRRPDVVKLAHGEHVALARLEAVYAAGTPLVRQIFLHGRAHLVAIVVPGEGGHSAGAIDLELRRVAAAAKLRSVEVPRAVALADEPFTVANGLLTESGKPARPRLAERYRERIAALHASLERGAEETAAASIGAAVRALVVPLLDPAARGRALPDDVALGRDGLALDSMRLLELVVGCEARFGVDVPLAELPAGATLGAFIDLVARRRRPA
jgi:fatty acid CoA ligase FadD9